MVGVPTSTARRVSCLFCSRVGDAFCFFGLGFVWTRFFTQNSLKFGGVLCYAIVEGVVNLNIEKIYSRLDDAVKFLWFMNKPELEITVDPDNEVSVFLKQKLMEAEMTIEHEDDRGAIFNKGILYDSTISKHFYNTYIFYFAEWHCEPLFDLIRQKLGIEIAPSTNYFSLSTKENDRDINFIIAFGYMDASTHCQLPVENSRIHQGLFNSIYKVDENKRDVVLFLLEQLYLLD